MADEKGTHSHVPSVSVVIPARDIAQWLPAQLEALSAQTYEGPLEIVVVLDESSTDGTNEVMRAWELSHPQFRSVVAPARGGIGQARNIGARHSSGALMLCCDGDDVADEGWVAGMVATAQSYEIFGGRLDYTRLGRTATSRSELQRDGLTTALGWRPWACGVSLGIWRRTFDQLGGFNEDYRRCEDVEFSWRAVDSGFALGFAPDAVVSYRQRGDMRSSLRQGYSDATWFPRLYRDFRASGMPRQTIGLVVRQWSKLIIAMPRSLLSVQRRGRWLRVLAQMLGQVRGSVRYRVFWPA